MKRVWGREGYLAQKEPVEEVAQVEVPSPLRSPSQQGDANSCRSKTPTPTPNPECDQEKQQLASSLFGGLSSQSSVCLVRLLFVNLIEFFVVFVHSKLTLTFSPLKFSL